MRRDADDATKSDEVEAALGGGDIVDIDPLHLSTALADLADPRMLTREVPHVLGELARIAVGSSDIALGDGDARFADAAWRDNPFYRRLGQSYVAWVAAVDRMADNPGWDWSRQARAHYVANIVTGLAAPTNTLVGNPAAMKRAFETAGGSLGRGFRNFLGDMAHNRGMPTRVDLTKFEVGKDLAVSPGAVVYREEMFELLQYAPTTPRVRARPLLLVPPQVNKHYFLDLSPGRSLVEYTVGVGIPFFAIVWRNPRPDHGRWGIEEYIGAQLRATEVVREITGSEDLNVLGACAGGLTVALMLAYLAAEDDARVHAAAFVVTMVDSSHPNLISMMGNDRMRKRIARDAEAGTVYDHRDLATNFAWMRPNDLVFGYVVNNWLLGNDPPAFDILAWNDDSANLPAAFDRDMFEVYNGNAAASPGALSVLGTPIDLSAVTCDSLVVAGLTDHITPWKASYMTSQLLGGDSEVIVTSTGHIQTIVSPLGKARATYMTGPTPGADPDEWMEAATKHEGSWWPVWAEWIRSRSGRERRAPATLGGPSHPPLDDAPGRYVREP